jgi:hypothetical protein
MQMAYIQMRRIGNEKENENEREWKRKLLLSKTG